MPGMTKIEAYLIDLGISYEEVSANAFFVNDSGKGLPGISVTLDEPIVVIRAKVMELPSGNKAALYEQLLKLNGTDMVHGAYGIDGNDLVLVDTLEYDTIDKNEFEAALDSIGLALSKHYSILGTYRD